MSDGNVTTIGPLRGGLSALYDCGCSLTLDVSSDVTADVLRAWLPRTCPFHNQERPCESPAEGSSPPQ
jgi:hypothetical protein